MQFLHIDWANEQMHLSIIHVESIAIFNAQTDWYALVIRSQHIEFAHLYYRIQFRNWICHLNAHLIIKMFSHLMHDFSCYSHYVSIDFNKR